MFSIQRIKFFLLSVLVVFPTSTFGQKSLFRSSPTQQLLTATKSKEENVPLIRKLIRSGADINRHDFASGVTWHNPLQYAAENNQWRTMTILIRAGANVNPKRPPAAAHYFSPLMHSVQGPFALVKLLVARGAKINDNNSYLNSTPLICAANAGRADIVSSLLKHGANPLQKDLHKNTALDIAKELNHMSVVSVLKNFLSKKRK